MDFKYKVSVVIPVYNAEEYLRECIDSVLHQKGFSMNDTEILLINDGSPDNSEEICQEYAANYPNVIYRSKENSGVSATRNMGIQMAQGKYILLLDSDDFLGDSTLAALAGFFDAHYDEIDLCTYTMYRYNAGKRTLHQRYSAKHYDRGTGVYDLNDYITLNQSTINVFFRNYPGSNTLLDTSMRLSEDQYFDDCIVMKKHKIGFVKEATYFYRVNQESVSRTINNPYYCFNEIMDYTEKQIRQFSENGHLHRYIQNQILCTFGWRLKSDMLFPHYLEGEEYEEAINRIRNILKSIDNEAIISMNDLDRFYKVFYLRMKGEQLSYQPTDEGFNIYTDEGELVCDVPTANMYLRRMVEHGNKVTLNLFIASPLAIFSPLTVLHAKEEHNDGTVTETDLPLKASRIPFYDSKTPIAQQYPASYTFDLSQVKKLTFTVPFAGKALPVLNRMLHYSTQNHLRHLFTKKIGSYQVSMKARDCITVHPYGIADALHRTWRLKYQIDRITELPKVLYYRSLPKKNRNVWLYVDSPKVIDNSFYQYQHDFDKKDGIDRYYVVQGDDAYVREKMTKEQAAHLVRYDSRKHRALFLRADKILVSFSSYSIYCPFHKYYCYADLFHYELIYLQHGILHAHLPFMYGKTFSDICRFVISSEFEKKNLIENYDYLPEDMIMAGMPRFSKQMEFHAPENRILFAPSWRSYLIGGLVNNERVLRTKAFLNSEWFKQFNAFLHSDALNDLLESNDLYLDFKLHPIFKPYEEHFDVSGLKRVNINYEETILDKYKMFITDFSSFQFDYIRLNRPIAYILPDKKEFSAGIHSYRELDLKYEDAFGPMFETAEGLIHFIEETVAADFEVRSPYKERMADFFSIAPDPCETIYQALIQK